ncbi:MAG: hypothetical protein H6712_20740 [Myxococcales bacterium]|nr:hypothetical protein [Myxococcales bacterium]MCB9716303.1 hypothetical protein [Myxococcales bacterium]
MARLHHVSRETLLALRPTMRGPVSEGPSWKASRPDALDAAIAPWFSLTPRSPSFDSRVGDSDAELSATMATFGGVTGPRARGEGLPEGTEPPAVVLGGNPVAPGTPAGPVAMRPRQCSVRLRLSAEGLAPGRQCLVLVAVATMGGRDHRVQLMLGETMLGEDRVRGEDRLGVLLDVPDDGRLLLELWLRLASSDAEAHLGVRGIQGHLL